jgi:hypothetical protein
MPGWDASHFTFRIASRVIMSTSVMRSPGGALSANSAQCSVHRAFDPGGAHHPIWDL